MMGQETRNKLTDYRQKHGIKKWDEYAILTNIIHQERMRGHPWALAKDIDDRMISNQNFLPPKKK